jgi:hypothetical protein
MSDPHPYLKHLADYVGTDDPDQVEHLAGTEFALYKPNERVKILQDYARAFDSDRESLRQKSELLRFKQKLERAHIKLRLAQGGLFAY